MDDIIEKLSLLDYENSFCKGWKHKRISRIHFAHPLEATATREEETYRVNLMYDMVYWLMSMNKEKVSDRELNKIFSQKSSVFLLISKILRANYKMLLTK